MLFRVYHPVHLTIIGTRMAPSYADPSNIERSIRVQVIAPCRMVKLPLSDMKIIMVFLSSPLSSQSRIFQTYPFLQAMLHSLLLLKDRLEVFGIKSFIAIDGNMNCIVRQVAIKRLPEFLLYPRL